MVWSKANPEGIEYVEIELSHDRLSAAGIAIGSQPVPFRLDYRLETSPAFITSRLRANCRGEGWSRKLDLRRLRSGRWKAAVELAGKSSLPEPGGDMSALGEALDCDLGLSPLTNSMPVLRERLLNGPGTANLVMAWVSVPDLSIHRSGQRYTHVRRSTRDTVVRYDDTDGPFTAQITFDGDGIVVDYPGIGRRL